MKKSELTQKIINKALDLGFNACAFTPSQKLSKEEPALKKWLNQGMHANMHYMQNHFEKRLDTSLLVEGSKTVISLLSNYFTTKKQADSAAPKISKYAYGKDYHLVIKDKLFKLLEYIQSLDASCQGRAFVDSAPLLERAIAAKAGLGWIGKNSLLLNGKLGSYVFISELVINLELEYNTKEAKNFCGDCTRCIDACPTGAIVSPGVVDARKCISYHTIENKDKELPAELKGKFENNCFGCDICQDVCPWNSKIKPHNEPLFDPKEELLNKTKYDWQNLKKDEFSLLFKDSPVKRTGYNGLMRNIKFLDE